MRLVVIGGGEHARVVVEAARSRPDLWEVSGFVDSKPKAQTENLLQIPQLGGDAEGRALAASDSLFILGLAAFESRDARLKLASLYDEAGVRWATIVHASAWISPAARLAEGIFVSAGAIVNSGARIERHAVVNTGVILEHDVSVESFAQIASASAIGGGARLGRNVYVGLGARVRDHVSIGEGAVVGMGAVVVGAVPEGRTVVGNPARELEGRR